MGPNLTNGVEIARLFLQDKPDLVAGLRSIADVVTISGTKVRTNVTGAVQLANIGNVDAKGATVKLYLGSDAMLNQSVQLLKSIGTGKLKAGQSRRKTFKLKITGNAKSNYVIAVVDSGNSVDESLEINNQSTFQIPVAP